MGKHAMNKVMMKVAAPPQWSSRMLKNSYDRYHSDLEWSKGEESRSGNPDLIRARFLVVP
jgi:hypothetical protein